MNIKIETSEGKETIDRVYKTANKNLFVHRTYKTNAGWTITHKPTGYSIAQCLDSRKEAKQFVEIIQLEMPELFDRLLDDNLNSKSLRKYASKYRQLLRAIKFKH